MAQLLQATDRAKSAKDRGFQEQIQVLLYEIACEKSEAGVTGDDLAYANGILNGEVNVYNMAVGVANKSVDLPARDDAEYKTAIEALWPMYAKAWGAKMAVATQAVRP